MKVVFDLYCSQPVGDIMFSGGGEYTKAVFRDFSDYKPDGIELVVCYDKDKFLDDWILALIRDRGYTTVDTKNSQDIVHYLEQLDKSEPVRFFAGLPYSYKNVSFPENVVSIGTFHGLRFIELPYDQYVHKYLSSRSDWKDYAKIILKDKAVMRYRNSYQASMRSFSELVTDSQHSAYSIRMNFPEIMAGKKIRVFYPQTQTYRTDIDLSACASEDYIMMISADRWSKNSYRGVMAIDDLYEKGLLPKTVRTRVLGGLPERIQKELKHKDRFDFLGYVSSEELENTYRHCEIFFYPTLNEGFGNVPMEAMKYGKTCVVSAVCSLPEVYENSVYYCNPYDIMEMQNRILQALEHKKPLEVMNKRLNEIVLRQRQDMEAMNRLLSGETEA